MVWVTVYGDYGDSAQIPLITVTVGDYGDSALIPQSKNSCTGLRWITATVH